MIYEVNQPGHSCPSKNNTTVTDSSLEDALTLSFAFAGCIIATGGLSSKAWEHFSVFLLMKGGG